MIDYHIIGDIHGQADKLDQLLQHLGYQKQEGIYQHPNAKVVFLGDFIDRGQQQRRVIDIIRPCIKAAGSRSSEEVECPSHKIVMDRQEGQLHISLKGDSINQATRSSTSLPIAASMLTNISRLKSLILPRSRSETRG